MGTGNSGWRSGASTFPSQALPCSGSTGIISARKGLRQIRHPGISRKYTENVFFFFRIVVTFSAPLRFTPKQLYETAI